MVHRIAVFGAGYLGATHAACMAELGHQVIGVDTDEAKLALLSRGEAPFYEPGLTEILRANVDAGRIRFTSSYWEAAQFADIHFIAVGTPQKRGELGADLGYINAVAETLAPHLDRPAVILGKSTVPVGTAARLSVKFRDLAPAGEAVEVTWNPEFLREGFAVKDTLYPDRIVLGVDSHRQGRVERVARELYDRAIQNGVPFLVTNRETAELVKLAANAFLATKISFINAVSDVCEASGADIVDLADAIGHDQRIGRSFLNAGVGFGGGCLPKDIRAFMARSSELGANQILTLMREVDLINKNRRIKMTDTLRAVVGGNLAGVRVAVLGAAFKPDSDDIRDAPALSIAGQAQIEGAVVTVYDPKAMDNARRLVPTLSYADNVQEACQDADATLVLTEWSEFRELDPSDLDPVVRCRRVLDGRNCLDPKKWRAGGWTYRGMGRL